ncbi:hypothetical protein ACFQ23_01125 [Schaalia naturae]|uniref:Xylose isomerase-like TIM barrel domain-containing protein n=1 Tax=Schaalia naturae TaxID=635203 RepID=A0ABW2SNV7_9ACTO
MLTVGGGAQGTGGATDLAALLRPVVDSGCRGRLVVEAEQDPAKADPFEDALKVRGYLRDALGV